MLAINNDNTTRLLILFALVAATIYLMLSMEHVHSNNVIVKTAMCLFLAAAAGRSRQKLLAIALLFSSVGDALLSINADRLFMPALASFLVTHLLYAAVFLRAPPQEMQSLWRKALAIVILAVAVAYTSVLWPVLGDLRLPVLVYIAVITAMAVLSLRMISWLLPLGAVLFMASDSLIAMDKFLWSAQWVGPAIWISYAAAQLLITCGLLASEPHRPRRQSVPASNSTQSPPAR